MRSTKKIYSTSALEAWFSKLNQDWERYFDTHDLLQGQKLYTHGAVSEIELTAGDAIIHMRENRESFYAVVNWESERLSVRYSRENEREGRALAAAGMYEIEELVCDEADPLPPVEATEITASNQAAEAKNNAVNDASANALVAVRPLSVVLDYKVGTLAMQAFWNYATKPLPAFGEKADPDTSLKERELLITLTSYAHRAGFRYQSKTSVYLFEDITSLPLFISKDWQRWKNRFTVHVTPAVESIFKGLQEVEMSMHLDDEQEDTASIRWDLRATGVQLNQKDVSRLLKSPERPVILPGKGLFKMPERRARMVREWRNRIEGGLQGEIPRYMLFSLFQESSLDIQLSDELNRWHQAFYKPPATSSIKLPEFLREYQRAGVHWLRHICDCGCHALLADEMGLGKTVQVLSMIASRSVDSLPSLIVCPASVLPVWQGEVARFFPQIETCILTKDQPFVPGGTHRLWLASYSQLRRHKHLLPEVEFAYAVLDEAQFIKNPEAKVTQACYMLRARHRIAMTGTPMENHYEDVWALFRFLMPGLLGTRQRFSQEATLRATGFAGHVRRQIAPFTLRRRKVDVLSELPEKTEVQLLCPLSDLQQQLYQKMANEGLMQLGNSPAQLDNENRMHLFSLLTRLRQVCCDPALLPNITASHEQSGKLTVLRDRLQELLENGHKVVVFSQFVELLKRVKQHTCAGLPGAVFELTGQTRKRGERVEAFQNHDGAAVMLVSLKAGGTGITLHAADYVFLLDPWWNPAVEAQAVDRVHRLGQTNKVMVYRMIAQNTLEEQIQKLQQSKQNQFDETIEQMDDISNFNFYLNSLSTLLEPKS